MRLKKWKGYQKEYNSRICINNQYSLTYTLIEDGCNEDDSYTSENDCKYKDKSKLEENSNIPVNDMDIDDDKLDKDNEEDNPNANNDYSVDNDMKRNQAAWDNTFNVSDDIVLYENSLDNQDPDDNDYDGVSDDCSDDLLTEDVPRTQHLSCMLRALGFNGSNKGLDALAWGNIPIP